MRHCESGNYQISVQFAAGNSKPRASHVLWVGNVFANCFRRSRTTTLLLPVALTHSLTRKQKKVIKTPARDNHLDEITDFRSFRRCDDAADKNVKIMFRD